MSRAPVSIVMITRNRRAETLATVRRLVALPEAPPVIVVDNASDDGTVPALREASLGIELIALDRNLGAAGRNAGVAHADTPYVAFADDDSWWAPGALAHAAALFDAHPALGLVNARILVGPAQRLDETCAHMAASPLRDSLAREEPRVGIPIVGFVACGAIVRRTAFVDAGGFHARFGVGGEEAVLALDLLQAGWAMRYVPELVAYHHPSPARDPAARRRREARNALWSAWLRRPVPSALVATWAACRRALTDAEGRAALVEALAGAPWAIRDRRPIPRHLEGRLRLAEDSFRAARAGPRR